MDGVTVTSTDKGDHGTYYAHIEGSRYVGRLEWTRHDNVLVVEHTIVPPEIGGHGIGKQLLERVIADAREGGLKVDPQCSFAELMSARRPEWADLRA